MSEETPTPVGCLIASTTALPELARMHNHVDDVLRAQRSHDDRLNRLHLQADDASRRLTRLESMVETQTRDTHELARRLDSIDSRVSTLVDGFTHVRDGIDSLMKAFTDHGIATNEMHNKRMRGQMTVWATLGAILVIVSALHYQQTGTTPLEALIRWADGLFP